MMKSVEWKRMLTAATPAMPETFHQRVETTLGGIELQEASMKEHTKQNIRRAGRFGGRSLAIALALTLMIAAVAVAAVQWKLFEQIPFLTGRGTPQNADALMQGNLAQETVNNVEITVREAGYDGRTLLLQYSYRILDTDEAFGITAAEAMGGDLPEGITKETIVEGLKPGALEALEAHQVGWNFDQLWFNGVGMDMPNNSGGVYQGSDVPGEIIYTEYWRLDNEGITLNGPTSITLPIGARVSQEEKKALFDRETGMYRLPETGVITFTYDAKDVTSQVRVFTPNVEKVLPDVTAKVTEAAFSPLMTYITLDLKVNPDVMADYLAANGEGFKDENGTIYWTYGGMDVFGDWLCSLELVDGDGQVLFPGHYGQNGYGNEWAEFLYPYLETLPSELYLAPIVDGVADMTQAVLVKSANL